MAKTNDSGQTLVETAISLSIFLLLVLGTIDFGYLISTKVTLQNAVRQGGRYAITGQCITGSDGSCSMTRYNSIMQVVENTSLGVAAASEISITCTGVCPNGAGGPSDLSGPIGALLHNSITLTVSSAFTNEAFPPSQS